MRSSIRRPGRATSLVALLVHLLLVAVGPLADGTLEAAAPEPEVHIEARADGACAPIHDHLTCQICRAVGRDLLTGNVGVPAPPQAPPVRIAAPDLAVVIGPAPALWTLGPRAPPSRI